MKQQALHATQLGSVSETCRSSLPYLVNQLLDKSLCNCNAMYSLALKTFEDHCQAHPSVMTSLLEIIQNGAMSEGVQGERSTKRERIGCREGKDKRKG